MKNINLLTILLCFGLSLIAKAESSRIVEHLPHIEETTRKHFILEAGYIGALSTAETEMADTKHGVSGGFLFDVFGERYFNFEIGVFVTQQGFAYGSKEITTVGATDVSALNELKVSGKSTYVGIPLLAKLNLAGRVSNTAFILAGISPQFLVANEVNI